LSDDEIIREAREAFERAADAEAENRRDALDDLRFARLGEQWPAQIKRERDLDGRPCLTINRLPALRRLTLIAPLACAMLTCSCASQTPRLPAAPRVEMLAEASKACSLYLLPATPTQSDLEIGYATRGAQVAACDAARTLAVQTHEAEHALEDQLTPKGRPPSR
jgi:hypothetical protein